MGKERPGLFYWVHTCPRVLDLPEPSWPKPRADSQGETLVARSVAWVQFPGGLGKDV